MTIVIEKAFARDSGHIRGLEIKAQEYPLPLGVIEEYIDTSPQLGAKQDKEAYVAALSGKVVGSVLLEFNSEEDCMYILRISVHPTWQNTHRIKVGSELMHHAEAQAWKRQIRSVRILIPSYKVEDKTDPDYLVPWLDKHHMKAIGVETDYYFRYGRLWDAYIFEKKL